MGVVGADVDQLRGLARGFDQAADRLETMAGSVTGMLGSAVWVGPDSERYRGEWHGPSLARVREVVIALRQAAAAVTRNADEQEQASSAGGTGWVGGTGLDGGYTGALPDRADVTNPMVDIRDFLKSNAVWPITWGTLLGELDRYQIVPLLDALGLATDARLSDQQRIIEAANSATDLAGGLIKAAGGPVGYLAGVGVAQWGDVLALAAQSDFSASTLQTTAAYIAQDPGGAFEAARDAVIGYVPKLFSNLLP